MTRTGPPRTEDVAWLLLRHGYDFSEELRRRRGLTSASAHPAVPVTVLGSDAVLLGGPEGVREFTDPDRFARAGATPAVVGHVVFGREVRRLAPFVPLLVARSRTDGEVLGVQVPAPPGPARRRRNAARPRAVARADGLLARPLPRRRPGDRGRPRSPGRRLDHARAPLPR